MTTIKADINDARPTVLEHFVGQDSVVQRVKVALEASWRDGTRLPHLLFTGQAGMGKTGLANVIAKETGSRIIEQLAQNLSNPNAVQGFLLEADDRDVLFIDEIHELMPQAQVLLYRALEERRLFLPSNQLRPGPPKVLKLANFTLIGATTDEYALLPPLLSRFKIVGRFSKYSILELTALLQQRCKKLDWSTEPGVIEDIARRGRGTPRRALTLLEAVYRSSRASGEDIMTMDHFEQTCRLESIDRAGLNEIEQRYLRLLEAKSQPIRLNVIASRLGVPPRTIQQIVETDLIEEGYVDKLAQGERQITTKARRHLMKADATTSDSGSWNNGVNNNGGWQDDD